MGPHPVNFKERNTKTGRIAHFTEKMMTNTFDGDYYRGSYEDNGELVTKTSSMWGSGQWEHINE